MRTRRQSRSLVRVRSEGTGRSPRTPVIAAKLGEPSRRRERAAPDGTAGNGHSLSALRRPGGLGRCRWCAPAPGPRGRPGRDCALASSSTTWGVRRSAVGSISRSIRTTMRDRFSTMPHACSRMSAPDSSWRRAWKPTWASVRAATSWHAQILQRLRELRVHLERETRADTLRTEYLQRGAHLAQLGAVLVVHGRHAKAFVGRPPEPSDG